jgi:hypothetical protein
MVFTFEHNSSQMGYLRTINAGCTKPLQPLHYCFLWKALKANREARWGSCAMSKEALSDVRSRSQQTLQQKQRQKQKLLNSLQRFQLV